MLGLAKPNQPVTSPATAMVTRATATAATGALRRQLRRRRAAGPAATEAAGAAACDAPGPLADRSVPQAPQNLLPSRFLVPQLGQNMAPSRHRGASETARACRVAAPVACREGILHLPVTAKRMGVRPHGARSREAGFRCEQRLAGIHPASTASPMAPATAAGGAHGGSVMGTLLSATCVT